MKDKLGGKIMKEFVRLRARINSYLTDNNNESKKVKITKNCVIRLKIFKEPFKIIHLKVIKLM